MIILGVKKFGGQEVFPGDIVARQRGFKWHPGKNTYWGKDHTIHAKCEVSSQIIKQKEQLIGFVGYC